jgi:hypothetical protein
LPASTAMTRTRTIRCHMIYVSGFVPCTYKTNQLGIL